ncbi:MAG: glycosyltransferase family 4 protein [Candidatus Woesearchaeota archaeon]
MEKKIYILAQIYDEDGGSFCKVFKELAKLAYKQGYKVTVLCGLSSKKQKLYERLPYAEIIRFPVPNKLPFLGLIIRGIFLANRIKKYFKKNKVSQSDKILANGETALGVLNQKYIWRTSDQPAFTFLKNLENAKEHSSLISRLARAVHLSIHYFIEKLCIKNARAIIFASQKSRQLFTQYYDAEKKAYFIPRSGVAVKELKKGDKKIFTTGRKLLFVSSNAEKIRKGVTYLEKILPELFAKFKELKLIHVGDKFEWNVPEWCKERIISVGRVPWSRMKDYYKTADIFVSCSLHEGFPNALLEAMAAGTPIVTSDIEGIEEYIRHGKEGLIFRRGDTKELRECIEYLLKNPSIRKQMAEKAFARARTLDYSIYAKKLLYFIEKIYENEKDSQIHINLLERNKSI